MLGDYFFSKNTDWGELVGDFSFSARILVVGRCGELVGDFSSSARILVGDWVTLVFQQEYSLGKGIV